MPSRTSRKWRSAIHNRERELYPRFRNGVVRRVVLDTNVAWYLAESDLRALVERGFLLSISIEAMSERWAKAARENNSNLLRRARTLDGLLDPRMRVAFLTREIEEQLGGTARPSRGQRLPFRELAAEVDRRWRQIVGGAPPDWREMGQVIGAALDEQASRWSALLERVPSVVEEANARAGNHEGAVPELDAVIILARQLAADLPLELPGGAVERQDAASRVFAAHAVRAVADHTARNPNDYEDFKILQHLAAPVFLVTEGKRLIKLVDQSRSYQAPWIRTPAEMNDPSLPTGVPWGRTARSQAARFTR